MRLYTFCNYYLSSIQHGIQTAHVVHELFNKYFAGSQYEHLDNWSRNHKTIVVLNGGNSDMLRELYEFMHTIKNAYPYVKFHEDEQSLNSALTCVGIVLPEQIYEAAAASRQRDSKWKLDRMHDWNYTLEVPDNSNTTLSYVCNKFGPFTPWEKEFIERLNTYGLAK